MYGLNTRRRADITLEDPMLVSSDMNYMYFIFKDSKWKLFDAEESV